MDDLLETLKSAEDQLSNIIICYEEDINELNAHIAEHIFNALKEIRNCIQEIEGVDKDN